MGTRKYVTAGQRTDVPPVPSPRPVFDSYGRLSKSPDTGEFEKIETQWADNRKVIDRLGGVLGAELERRFAQLAITHARKKYYTCEKERRGCGKVNADVRSVDQELRALVILRLSDDRYAAAVEAARAQVAVRLSAINAEIADYEGLQEAVSERLGSRRWPRSTRPTNH